MSNAKVSNHADAMLIDRLGTYYAHRERLSIRKPRVLSENVESQRSESLFVREKFDVDFISSTNKENNILVVLNFYTQLVVIIFIVSIERYFMICIRIEVIFICTKHSTLYTFKFFQSNHNVTVSTEIFYTYIRPRWDCVPPRFFISGHRVAASI